MEKVFGSPTKWFLVVASAFLTVALAFTWGVATGTYRVFPWQTLYWAKQQFGPVLRTTGVVPIRPETPRLVQPIYTGLMNFDLTIVNNTAPVLGQAGGFAIVIGGVLIGRNQNLYYFDERSDQVRTLPFTLPPRNEDKVPSQFQDGRTVRISDQRYHDIEVSTLHGEDHIFVTYNRFEPSLNCFTLRLDEAILPRGWQHLNAPPLIDLRWRKVLRTSPCLPPSRNRNTLGGNQGGGRIVISADRLLVSTGDFEFDGIGGKQPAVSQIQDSDYGRVLESRLGFDKWTELSKGHRNPQGLAFDKNGRLWVAEQGPMGGDELNLIQQGSNYGWPLVSLGVFYTDLESDSKSWPASTSQGRHVGYQTAEFAWMPSIATSSLALVEGIDRWEGDLLVGTLVGESIHRIRLEGTRVLYDEKIPLNRRIRDVAVSRGRIYVLFDDGRFGYMTPHQMTDADPARAMSTQILRKAGCVVCHSKPALPRMAGILGREVASQPDVEYSPALRSVPGVWTKERLKSFLRSPTEFAPGTTMPDPNLDADTLKKIVEELEVWRP